MKRVTLIIAAICVAGLLFFRAWSMPAAEYENQQIEKQVAFLLLPGDVSVEVGRTEYVGIFFKDLLDRDVVSIEYDVVVSKSEGEVHYEIINVDEVLPGDLHALAILKISGKREGTVVALVTNITINGKPIKMEKAVFMTIHVVPQKKRHDEQMSSQPKVMYKQI